jgi:hypothetical protein
MALPFDGPLMSYAKHHTGVFSSLRNSIKRDADMFLFGEPTDKLVKLMIKVYHENILRLLSSSRDKTKPDGTGEKLQCMFGIMENSDGQLYVTISESPGTDRRFNSPSDPDYMLKRAMMINILLSAGVTIHYPELDAAAPRSPFPAPILLDENRWRKGPGEAFDTIPEAYAMFQKIKANPALDNVMILEAAPQTTDVYHRSIRDADSMDITVNWVDSFEYLMRRAAGDTTFPPFKKYSLNARSGTWQAECNNGHLCTESKLFGYAKLKGLRPQSFVAYWIGKSLPPENHMLKSYSYRTVIPAGSSAETIREIEAETEKLDALRKRCESALGIVPPAVKNAPNFQTMLTSAVQPIAVACPGCYANMRAYMSGTMSEWNSSNCYKARRALAEGGGKRKKTRRSKRKVRKTRKH